MFIQQHSDRLILYVYYEKDQRAPKEDPLLRYFKGTTSKYIPVADDSDPKTVSQQIIEQCNRSLRMGTIPIVIINLFLGGTELPRVFRNKYTGMRELLPELRAALPYGGVQEKGLEHSGRKTLVSYEVFRTVFRSLRYNTIFAFTYDRISLSPQTISYFQEILWDEGISLFYSWNHDPSFYERSVEYLNLLTSEEAPQNE